jgi:cell division protein ZapA
MSNVTVSIGGRSYTVACDTGQEAHIAALGRLIDSKLSSVPGVSGQSEARTLLFAALLLADELDECGKRPNQSTGEPDRAEALEAVAARLEVIVSGLEKAR